MAAAGGILVKDIPRGLSGEIISQYFFSRGGDIKAFRLFEGGRKALVEFEDTSVVAGILSASHRIGRHVVSVSSANEVEPAEPSSTHDGARAVMKSSKPVLGDVVITTKECYPALDPSYEPTPVQNDLVKRTVNYELSEWKTISKSQLLREIESSALSVGVKIVIPSAQASVFTIGVVGSLSAVSQIVQLCEDAKKQIHVSSKILNRTPGLWAVLQSMKDKIRILEHELDAVVSISATCSSVSDEVDAGINHVAFTAVVKQCCIEVCFGNFTHHSSATTILNIVVPGVDQQYLNQLAKGGGENVYEDILGRMKELSGCELPQVFETKPHNLSIKKLIHCVVLQWNGGKEKEVHVLEEALSRAVMNSALPCVVISPSSLPPSQYPPVVVAEVVIKTIENINDILDISGSCFALYVVNRDEANAIEKLFQHRHIEIQFKDSYRQLKSPCTCESLDNTSVDVLTSKLPSFLSIVKGDLLHQKVDAYVNSTNSDLDLSRGMLSRQLLRQVGQKLQEECNEYAPLSAGQVAVTSAQSLLSDVLLHVAPPAYKSKGSERVLRETMRNLLQVCLNRSVTSIAIPSLGAGKLGYPHNVVADILFTEVLGFNNQHPSFFKKIIFVLSENEIYETFMKVYVQRLHISSAKEVEMQEKEACNYGLSTRLHIIHGSIEEENVDVIINPTTHDVDLSSNPVSQAISEKAGLRLRTICHQHSESGVVLSEKNSLFTIASGQLRCKKVLHVYTPTKCQSQTELNSVIHSVVLDALNRVEKEGYRSVSLPLLGYNFPVEGRTMAVIKAALKFGESAPLSLKEIRLVVLDRCHYEGVCSCFIAHKSEYSSHCSNSALEVEEGDDCVLEVQPRSRMASKHTYRSLQPWDVADLKRLEDNAALIKVYSVIPGHDSWVIQEIESKVTEELITEFIYNNHIPQLISSEVADINRNLCELGVAIDLKKAEKEIMLSGQKDAVREAQTVVMKMLDSLQHANMMLNQIVWQRATESDIQLYPKEVGIRLEMAKVKKVQFLEVHAGEINVVIDLEKMLEIDLKSGKTSCVQRVKKMFHIEFPPYWQPQPNEHGLRKLCHMFSVTSDTEEYQSAVKEFKDTMYGMEYSILSLHRIQNSNEYTKHSSFLEVLKERYHGQVQLKRLFHGTSASSVQAIAHQGFNRIFAADANAAVFGKGVYFAARANYSAQEKYAVPDEYGNQKMFICHVVVGKYTKGERAMKVAPPLDASKNEHLLYDTLVDDPANPTIYVVMSDSQAYPEYLVTFRSKRK